MRLLRLASLGFILALSGCVSLVEMTMRQKNEQDLHAKRLTPSEFRQREEDIDRAFRGK